jgi:MFS family permease
LRTVPSGESRADSGHTSKERVEDGLTEEASTAASSRGATQKAGIISALQHYPPYRTLWTTAVLTQIAHWMFQIASAWLILRLTGSPFYVGLLGFFAGVPFLLVSMPAGVIIDRFDRRRILMVTQVAALGGGLAVGLLAAFDLARPWHLLAVTFFSGAAVAVKNATQQTMVPGFVPREGLQNAIALMGAGQNTTRIFGPGLAGPALALVGVAGTYFLQVGVLAASIVNTLRLPQAQRIGAPALSLRRNLADGVSYVAKQRVLTGLLLFAICPTLLAFPYLSFLPVFANDILDIGPAGLSLLFAAGGLGALSGALIVAGADRIKRRGRFVLIVTIIYGFTLTVFAYSTWLPLSLLMLYISGVFGSSFMSMNNTLLQLNVEDEVRGRVMGVYMLTFGMPPLGALPMGIMASWIGMSHALAAGAVMMLIMVTIVSILYPELRRL